MANDTILSLAETIRSRRSVTGDKSYTRQLLDRGPEHCARKFGEEAIETVIAGVTGDDKALTAEAADVIYHLLVLLEVRGIDVAEVYKVLDARKKQSGLAEKAARNPS